MGNKICQLLPEDLGSGKPVSKGFGPKIGMVGEGLGGLSGGLEASLDLCALVNFCLCFSGE